MVTSPRAEQRHQGGRIALAHSWSYRSDNPICTRTRSRASTTFLTNHLDFGATTIAAIYKDRWSVELFFKALKQNLKIRSSGPAPMR